MKPLSASAAAKAVGKSIPTITRAIKSGRLSAKSLDGGGYEIDPSELFRVYPAVTVNPDEKGQMFHGVSLQKNDMLQVEIATLKAKLTLIEESTERERQSLLNQVEDLKTRLDAETEERRALSQRLLAAPQEVTGKRKGFFRWFATANA